MNTILCFLSLSLIGWICLFMGLSKSRHFKSRAAVETSRAEGIIQSYEVKEKPWGRGPTAWKCVDRSPSVYLRGATSFCIITRQIRSNSTLNWRLMIEAWKGLGCIASSLLRW